MKIYIYIILFQLTKSNLIRTADFGGDRRVTLALEAKLLKIYGICINLQLI